MKRAETKEIKTRFKRRKFGEQEANALRNPEMQESVKNARIYDSKNSLGIVMSGAHSNKRINEIENMQRTLFVSLSTPLNC